MANTDNTYRVKEDEENMLQHTEYASLQYCTIAVKVHDNFNLTLNFFRRFKSLNVESDAKPEADANAKGGRRERMGYIMASAGRGPLAVMSVFWGQCVMSIHDWSI